MRVVNAADPLVGQKEEGSKDWVGPSGLGHRRRKTQGMSGSVWLPGEWAGKLRPELSPLGWEKTRAAPWGTFRCSFSQ